MPRNIYIEKKVEVPIKEEVLVREEKTYEKATVRNIEQPPRIIVQTQEIPR